MVPSLPTDNLYKFIAISGLTVLMFAQVFMNTQLSGLEDQLHEQRLRYIELEAEIKYKNTEAQPFLGYLKSATAEINSGRAFSEQELEEMQSKINEMQSALLSDQLDIEVNEKTLEETGKRMEELGSMLEKNTRWLRFVSIFSLVSTVAGVCLWYVKIQRHIDKGVSTGACTG